ncbi:G protein-coupled receptor-6.1 [Proboscivirus elephantidbeta4]|uniref:G protein-coupled receptor-6.1 n=1 Tax=Elephant endotheliotropic herpesvirus 4 TaxID=548914 RepID=A0A0S1TQ53_9BETA|nr:G protein-coupled receptor-6.1 [Elephant endotheliotropic herpesvirus 4]ALM25926.1 G protein-coupled receptor-6.1 [Elephant endotheliotropic herpesvirus 4]
MCNNSSNASNLSTPEPTHVTNATTVFSIPWPSEEDLKLFLATHDSALSTIFYTFLTLCILLQRRVTVCSLFCHIVLLFARTLLIWACPQILDNNSTTGNYSMKSMEGCDNDSLTLDDQNINCTVGGFSSAYGISLTVLSLVGVAATLFSILTFVHFDSKLYRAFFPRNTWSLHYILLAATLAIFLLAPLYVWNCVAVSCFSQVPFAAAFACLLLLAFNLLAIHRYQLAVPSQLLRLMALFLTIVSIVTVNSAYVNALADVRPDHPTHITDAYLYAIFLIMTATWISGLVSKTSVYARTVFAGSVSNCALWVAFWCACKILTGPLILATGFSVLAFYIAPQLIFFFTQNESSWPPFSSSRRGTEGRPRVSSSRTVGDGGDGDENDAEEATAAL